MAPKPCAKYEYVEGKIIPVLDQQCKDEESPADYNPGGYLPISLGDTFKHGRYRVLRKLGWGHFSTVWLVKDVEANRHSALKVVKSAGRYAETAIDEIKLLNQIAAASPSHSGRCHIVSFLDSFSHVPLTSSLSQSPTHSLSTQSDSAHICIVFEPLGENLLSLIARHKQKGVPRALVKYIAKQVLLGLQYLHEECKLIHTDIKPENILIQIPDVESHIHSELTSCPSPTSRRVALPPPSRHRASRHGVAIPKTRERLRERRQVQIFDSQPLGSPVLTGSYGSGLATSLPVPSNLCSARPVVKRTATAGEHLTSPSISTSSSSSSLASALASGSTPAESSVISTPPTSVSLGYGFSVGMISVTKNQNMASIGEDKEKKESEERIKEWKLKETIQSQIESAMSSSLPTSVSPPSPTGSLSSKATDATTKRPTLTATKAMVVNPMKIKAKPKIGLMGGTGVPGPALVSVNAVSVSPSQGGFVGPAHITNPAPQASTLYVTFTPESPSGPTLVLPSAKSSYSPTPIPTPPAGPGANSGPSLLSQIRPRHVHISNARDEVISASHRASSSSSSLTPTPTSPSAPPPTPSSDSPSPLHSAFSSPQIATAIELEEPPPLPIQIKIADLGNATYISRHFTDEIQTRQYRAPEAILGRKDWGCAVDVWSVGCLIFELLTAEYLFDPQGHGEVFSKDDDHMAQIIELLDDFPLELKMGGRYSRDLFDSDGKLRFIAKLKKWPLRRVMVEKYLWTEEDTKEFCDFLEMMLVIDWRKRSAAGECAKNGWLEVKSEDWGDELNRV